MYFFSFEYSPTQIKMEMLPWQPAAAVVWVWLQSPVQQKSYTCVAPDSWDT